jgi:hypothetical protein
MLKPETSRLLAYKKQIAIYNRDLDMIKKIENIKKEADVTPDIINYKSKEDVN